MPTRRQEKVARVVKEAVSDAIANRLSDPRIEGFVSVTRVEMAADLRSAEVFLSIFGDEERTRKRTFEAIQHARTRIQSLLARRVKSKFCPILRLQLDEEFSKTMETMRLIDQVAEELSAGDEDLDRDADPI